MCSKLEHVLRVPAAETRSLINAEASCPQTNQPKQNARFFFLECPVSLSFASTSSFPVQELVLKRCLHVSDTSSPPISNLDFEMHTSKLLHSSLISFLWIASHRGKDFPRLGQTASKVV
jgi:hypothetical protein